MDSWPARFRELVDKFLFLPVPHAKMWQHLLSHLASLEQFVPKGQARMHPLQQLLNTFWSAALDDLVKSVPLSEACRESIN